MPFYDQVAIYLGMKQSNTTPDLIRELEIYTKYIIWWIGLGVFSSIGFGSGIQTGLMFLFPHILKICLASEKCGHASFNILEDVFYSSISFSCGGPSSQVSDVSFLRLLLKVAPSSMLWGVGSAIGEIPPYWMAFYAIGGNDNSEWESVSNPVGHWNKWMIAFIECRGFFGIFALASWPNAAFDVCGMACGAFRMPFITFFLGTVLGKGFVKVNIQNVIFLGIFRRDSREKILDVFDFILPKTIPILSSYIVNPPSIELRQLVNRSMLRFMESVGSKDNLTTMVPTINTCKVSIVRVMLKSIVQRFDTIGEWWTFFMFLCMGYFFVSILSTLAVKEERRSRATNGGSCASHH